MWPFRKKPSFGVQAMRRADQEIEAARRRLESELANLTRQFAEQYEQMQRIANGPVRGFVWTPVINPYGQIVALAWKNDIETAKRLLEDPAEGRA